MKCLGLLLAFTTVVACSKGDSSSTAAQDTTGAGTSNKVSLTAADLDGFEKGLTEEIRLVKEGQLRASKASTPTERGNAITSTFEENTTKAAIPVSGLSFERYHQVRDVMGRLLTTLDFQDKIPGPQSVDTARADSAMKERLHSDPYAELDAPSAELVKSRLDKIAPIWIEYTKLTVAGG
jgi:hypothetical protein